MVNKNQKQRIFIAKPDLDGNELNYVQKCIKTNWISSKGSYIKEFEEKFSKYCGKKYGVAVSNGTVALHLALIALGIKQGDEVIVPTLTFIAPANAISYVGAKPVFVDSEKETGNIDANKIKEKITKKTKAIIPVHLYGQPCDMDIIMKIAKTYNLFVIEDCAEAHGAEYKGKKVGSFGDVSCFSFFGNKIITTGEGGMCLTDNEELAEKIRMLKDHGMTKEKRYWHPVIGYNYRLTNIQAAVGVAQLERIDEFLDKRRKNAKLYDSLLKDIKEITLFKEKKNTKNICWMYNILADKKEALMKKLEEENIETRPFFYPIHSMPPHKTDENFLVAEELSRKGISLPCSTSLKKSDIERICEVIRDFYKK